MLFSVAGCARGGKTEGAEETLPQDTVPHEVPALQGPVPAQPGAAGEQQPHQQGWWTFSRFLSDLEKKFEKIFQIWKKKLNFFLDLEKKWKFFLDLEKKIQILFRFGKKNGNFYRF